MKMKATKAILALFGVSLLALGAYASPTVSIVDVRQRYPWNNTVDIVYRVTGYDSATDVDKYFVTFDATIPGIADPIECTAGQMVSANGDFTVNWDCSLDSVVYTDSAKLTLSVYNLEGQLAVADLASADYEIWDLTDLSAAPVYEKVPEINGTPMQRLSNARYNADEYKTTKLVLRKVPASATTYPLFTTGNVTRTVDETYLIGIYELTEGQYGYILQSADPSGATGLSQVGSARTLTSTKALASISQSAIYGGDKGTSNTATASKDTAWTDNNSRTGTTPLLKLMNDTAASANSMVFDLPTDQQWEIAARGGVTADTYWWWRDGSEGNPVCKVTTTYTTKELADAATPAGMSNEELRLYAVTKLASGSNGARSNVASAPTAFNPWGLADMYGNVWEWVRNRAGDTAYNTATVTSTFNGSATGSAVRRGGAYSNGADRCSSVGRDTGGAPGSVHDSIGVRLARVLSTP